ncbi:MAG: hypothetical protein HYV29_00375 [Ignavibacteriales bacterium]|nr:hypothetical protein [Ignavibacteriales bacterium]
MYQSHRASRCTAADERSVGIVQRGSIILFSVLLVYFSSCTSPRKAESNLRSVEMRWVQQEGNSHPRAIILNLESADTVRVMIKNSGGDPVAQEFVTVLNFGRYRLESTFAPLIPGAYFVEVRTSSDTFVKYVNIGH